MSVEGSLEFEFQTKEVSEADDYIEIEGYASTHSKDRDGDIIVIDAWNSKALKNYKKNPILLAYHDHKQPIGETTSIEVDDKGLKVKGKIYKAAGSVYTFIKNNVLKTFSVGFLMNDATYDPKDDTFYIRDVELWEISVVSVPANADATFSLAKSASDKIKSAKEVYMAEKENEGLREEVNELKEALEAHKQELSQKEAEANKEAETVPNVEITREGVESLINDSIKAVEEKYTNESKQLQDEVETLKATIKEKEEEVKAFQNNKMRFSDRKDADNVSKQEKDTAVLLSKLIQRPVKETSYGYGLLQKSTGDHIPSAASGSDPFGDDILLWETEFSNRMLDEIRERLVVAPLFDTIPMNAVTMRMPINPESRYAEYVDLTTARNSPSHSDASGTAGTHRVNKERFLTAVKVAAKEFYNYEEEEDSLIPFVPIIRTALVRSMGKTIDRTLLRGGMLEGTENLVSEPINGLAWHANTLAREVAIDAEAGGASEKVTVMDHLQAARRKLGYWGLNPNDVVYIVSHDAYYDLVDDPEFRTMDLVGDRAAILSGQVGEALGSPILISGELLANKSDLADGEQQTAVIAVNPSNFAIGNYKGVTVERDKLIEQQRNLILTTRRFGFTHYLGHSSDDDAGEGVARVLYYKGSYTVGSGS